MNEKLTFDEKVNVQITFNACMGVKGAAEFAVHLQETIDGLTNNNETFRQGYHYMATEIRRLRNIEAEFKEHIPFLLEYARFGDSAEEIKKALSGIEIEEE